MCALNATILLILRKKYTLFVTRKIGKGTSTGGLIILLKILYCRVIKILKNYNSHVVTTHKGNR